MREAARRMVLMTVVLAEPLSGYIPGIRPPEGGRYRVVKAESRRNIRMDAGADHPPVTGGDASACISCHSDITTRRVTHGPVAAGNCSGCHVVADRRVTLKAGTSSRDTAPLCVTCHAEIADRLRARHRHAPVASGDCTACHDPHGSPFRFQLKADGSRACVSCHDDIAQALAQPHAHAPAAASCQICHDPHAATYRSQLRGEANAVCLACHFEAPLQAGNTDPVGIFGRKSAQIEQLIATGPRIPLDPSRVSGHPTIRHPIEGWPDPVNQGRTLGCASCHNPHGAAGKNLLRFGATGVSSLCIRCHSM